eukprot:c30419_g1_i1 orf=521-1009(+)
MARCTNCLCVVEVSFEFQCGSSYRVFSCFKFSAGIDFIQEKGLVQMKCLLRRVVVILGTDPVRRSLPRLQNRILSACCKASEFNMIRRRVKQDDDITETIASCGLRVLAWRDGGNPANPAANPGTYVLTSSLKNCVEGMTPKMVQKETSRHENSTGTLGTYH